MTLTKPFPLGYHTHNDYRQTAPRQEEAMAIAQQQQTYNVGGVMLKQPFKLQDAAVAFRE